VNVRLRSGVQAERGGDRSAQSQPQPSDDTADDADIDWNE
jgi:hypothetical protein